MSEGAIPPAPGVPSAQDPAYSYPPAAAPERPGRTLGIVGFVLSFVGFIDVAGLIICIVAMVKSKRAGQRNGFALAGIIISIAGILFCAGIIALIAPPLIQAGQQCARLGDGTHVIEKSTYTCTPTSFSVYTHP
ncbi:DUF4190 domain-containing protein [Leifsonia sp. YAF41]|uniref:DUF4190 domain-containing protein n=1 Tax=Leifsonia sp. YAF41 TaxID=3233086 RepID=UPI003F9D96DF